MDTRLELLTDDAVRNWFADRLPVDDFAGKRVLLIVPDATRIGPAAAVVRCTASRICAESVATFDVLVALGTHPPMSRNRDLPDCWVSRRAGARPALSPDAVCSITNGTIRTALIDARNADRARDRGDFQRAAVDERAGADQRAAFDDYDCCWCSVPVFPHEVVGFSGGNKYFFPGIAGPELLNFFHWLGALDHECGDHRRARTRRCGESSIGPRR